MNERKREYVGFKQVYDLVFRAKNAKLESVAYVLDFHDWLKAGIAFNTRGYELSTRKISYFAELYLLLERISSGEQDVDAQVVDTLKQALVYYYADIFEVYQDHVRSKQSEAAIRNRTDRRGSGALAPEFGNLIVCPSFDSAPVLRGIFPTRTFQWDEYECRDPEQFSNVVASAYVVNSESTIASCMSLMYDYGINPVETGVLLEVGLWDKE